VFPASTAEAIFSSVQDAENVLVITHINPDGDALGSLTATGLALQQLGRSSTLVVDDGSPARFSFLPSADKIQTEPDRDLPYDLIIALDSGDVDRLGNAFANLKQPIPPIINIDHHITNTEFGQINLVNSEANATAELLFALFQKMGVDITADIAVCLLTGILTDTLGFRTAGVGSNTLRIASELIDVGADLYMVFTKALIQKPLSTILIWQKGLNNIKIEDGVIWTTISKQERQETGSQSVGSSGLGNLLADVEQVAMSAVLMETDNGKVSISFRCRSPFNVSELAQGFGGGGHQLASGCTIDGSLKDVESIVITQAVREMQRQNANLSNSRTITTH
jgi:phosphoesterase RecJ-like protein